MYDLSNKTILVTGASKGIGAAIAASLGQSGAHVVAHYSSDRAGAEDALAAVPADRKLLLQADFSDLAKVEALWEEAVAWRGRIDVLVNNAAVMHWDGGFTGEDDALWDRVWEETLQVNVLSPARLLRNAVRHYRESGGGIVVTVSSWAAQRGTSNPEAIAYAASKAAIKAAAQTVARGYAREDILSYVIAPGVVHTRLSETAALTQGGVAAVNAGLAMGEWVPPQEIGELTVFLASGVCRHLNGATFDVNGATYVR